MNYTLSRSRRCLNFAFLNAISARKGINVRQILFFASSSNVDGDDKDLPNISSWRRDELNGIAEKFKKEKDFSESSSPPIHEVRSDEDLQDMWKEMESRVTRRRMPMTLGEAAANGKPVGRSNVRRTDEEVWLEAGVYSSDKSDSSSKT